MTRASEVSATELGWSLLREGRWEAARERFEEALRGGGDASALEGLSWAAWWLDDEATVFATRERAYRLYRQADDARAAARMATWLGCDELDFHGAVPVAGGWLSRARRLLHPLATGPDHGWLAFMEGYMALTAGDTETAARLGAEAAATGREAAVADLEMLGLALEGSSLVARTRVPEGMRCLDEAVAAALEGDAEIPISSAWACCFLVSACTAVRDFERAFEWCERIAAFGERYGSRYMLAFCRAEYAAVHLWRGQWQAAEDMLLAAIEDFTESRPAMAGGPLATLAELRRRQGRTREAEALAERAGTHPGAALCRARLALDAGEARTAAEATERVLRQASTELGPVHVPALETLVRAQAAQSHVDAAAGAVDHLRAIAARAGTAPLHACADMAEGAVRVAAGEPGVARPLLEDAVDCFERCGAPYEAALARIELAGSLEALGRAEEAAAASAAARDALTRLGAAPFADGPAENGPVTPREQEVLALLADGLTNREIAGRLVVSEHTVHRHVANILRKLDVSSRAAAAAHAVRTGLVERPPA